MTTDQLQAVSYPVPLTPDRLPRPLPLSHAVCPAATARGKGRSQSPSTPSRPSESTSLVKEVSWPLMSLRLTPNQDMALSACLRGVAGYYILGPRCGGGAGRGAGPRPHTHKQTNNLLPTRQCFGGLDRAHTFTMYPNYLKTPNQTIQLSWKSFKYLWD